MKNMSRIQILSAQIQTDINSIIEDLAQGMSTENIIKEMVMLNNKIKDWAKEVDSILEV